MPIVGLDARATEPGFKAHYGRGTGRYATELVRHLSGLSAPDLAIRPLGAREFHGPRWQEWALKVVPFGRQSLHTQLFLPAQIRRFGVDFVHFMAHGDATSRSSVPYFVTVLDLIPLRFPDLYRANKAGWRFELARKLEKQAILSARGILAISEATKRDVVEILGVHPDKIVVTHLGVGEQFQPRPPTAREWNQEARVTKERLGLDADRPLLLYTGGIDPRKNVPFLLEVFADLLTMKLPVKPLLALAGNYDSDDQFPLLKREMTRLGLEQDVKLLGFVPEEDLPALYRAAHIKVFPSLYEGFGLPLLEAMASGVPVVAGANSSLPEVGGNAALLLPDKDKRRWTEEIAALLINETRQGQLSQAGKSQARRFSWADTAQTTADAYRYFQHLPETLALAAASEIKEEPAKPGTDSAVPGEKSEEAANS